MTTSTLTLASFLLARIDEDEAVARAAVYEDDRLALLLGDEHRMSADLAGRIVATIRQHDRSRHDSARVLAGCAAKRRMLDLHRAMLGADASDGPSDLAHTVAIISARALDTLRVMASEWTDHPDFDPAWR